MVKDCCRPPADGFGERELRRETDGVGIESAIEPPPQPIEDLAEVVEAPSGVEAPRQARIEVVMKIDEAGEDQTAARIQGAGPRVLFCNFCGISDLDNALPPPDHRSLGEDLRFAECGDDDPRSQNRDRFRSIGVGTHVCPR